MSTTGLGYIHPDTGPLRSRVDLVAVRVNHAGNGPADDEVSSVTCLDVPTLYQSIADGTITCGMRIAAVMRAQLAGIPPLPQ